MTTEPADSVTRILLERPASVRRHLPLASDQGWMIPQFVVGSENEALRYLFDDHQVRRLGELSPIVLYGDHQVGKTALAITLSVRWSRQLARRPLAFATGRSFAADFAAALEIDDIASFRQRHRACQLLVLDDLDQLANAPAAQLELVGTLDTLAESSRPVVVTLDRFPAGTGNLAPSLTSRLAGGLSIALQPPRQAACREIISALIESLHTDLPTDELAAFCARVSTKPLTAPALQKIVTLAAQNRAAHQSIDFPVLSQLVHQLFAGTGPTVPGIAKVVARKMQVRLSDMRGSTRQAKIVRARGLAMLLARKLTPTSLQHLGEYFGGRDHSTIIHACRKTEGLLECDTELANTLREAQAELLR